MAMAIITGKQTFASIFRTIPSIYHNRYVAMASSYDVRRYEAAAWAIPPHSIEKLVPHPQAEVAFGFFTAK